MRRLAASFTLSFTFSFLLPSSSLAFPVRSVYAERAQGEVGSIVKLKVWPGYGLNINFIPTGEIIKKVWIDDPSRIALSFDGSLCQWSGNQNQSQGQGQKCTNEGATVIHLRQIDPIKFENLPRSPGGGTLLTVITQGQGKRKLYQFQIVPASGEPEYTSLNILPDSEKPPPIPKNIPLPANLPLTNASVTQPEGTAQTEPDSNQGETSLRPTPPSAVTTEPSQSSKTSELEQLLASVSYANDVVSGLMIAEQKGEIVHGSQTWRKVRDAISHLRQGKSKEVAASRSGVPLSLLSRLAKWGQQESGSLEKSN